MSTYEEDGDLIRALVHEDLQLRGTLDQHKSSYRRQIQELKAMFRDTKRKKEKTTEERSSKKGPSVDPTPSSSSSSSSSAVSSVFADILLQLRVELDEKWVPLSQAERELNCEVRSECRKVRVYDHQSTAFIISLLHLIELAPVERSFKSEDAYLMLAPYIILCYHVLCVFCCVALVRCLPC